MAFRQCPKRLWLEIYKPELRQDSDSTQASFAVGDQVGVIARELYDPEHKGQLIDPKKEGFDAAFTRSTELLASAIPIFEAGFSAGGALAFADVMLPVQQAGNNAWRMIEVKSSTRVKDYYRDDVAVQAFVARSAGVPLVSVALAYIDNSWTYPGGHDYQGLLVENDLTDEAFGREAEVRGWIAEAQTIVGMATEPTKKTGRQCGEPYECGFLDYCQSQEPLVEYPVSWLPRIQAKRLKTLIQDGGIKDIRNIPDELLNDRQLRVKTHTLSERTYFDATGATADLAPYKFPAYFLDFETISFAVPIWSGTRPYLQIPFQYSLHKISGSDKLEHESFLDLTGEDPSRSFAESLLAACGNHGPVFVYNAGFETARIRELATRFPKLRQALLSINDRVVDLLRIAENRYYHPSQQGSWSIKEVLPTIAPDLRYEALDGVQDGGMAMNAYIEAISPDTAKDRKEQIEQQLLKYCALDTFAMVRLWQFFSGSKTELV
jgi:hypothetical protein